MLIDTMLSYCEQGLNPHNSNLAEGLTMALRFQVDNVACYAYGSMLSNGKDGQRFAIGDHIPNIAPLAPVMWFEFGGLAKGRSATNQYGCLVWVDYENQEVQRDDRWYGDAIPKGTRWVICSQGFARLGNEIVTMNWIHYIGISKDGEYLGVFARNHSDPHLTSEPKPPKGDFYNEELVALLAICFAHCKGATIEEHKPTRQVKRAAQRAGKPTFSFHTIDILPSTTILKSEGHISENGLARALHICRGHFAHYTTDHPLFGKYTGTFYRPMHIRGSASQGIAAKDYRVHPTKEAK